MAAFSSPATASGFRVILHVDMDAFYAAVEMRRLGLSAETPLVVQQWNGVIAINYAARSAGVKRGMVVDEVRRLCPAARFVHVEVIGNDVGTPGEQTSGDEDAASRRGETKVSLERYRRVSSKIFGIIATFLKESGGGKHAVVERASIDEAFIDVTSMVEFKMDQGRRNIALTPNQPYQGTKVVGADGEDRCVMPESTVDSTSAIRLVIGTHISAEIRELILNETGCSCSAGIATNKMLAKFASARNKPNDQTMVPSESIQALMLKTPIGKIRFLGGKLGAKLLTTGGAETAGQVQQFTKAELEAMLDPKSATFVYDIVRGIDRSEVANRDSQKSMLAAKSFAPETSIEGLEKWLNILAGELHGRMIFEETENNRTSTALTISFRNSKQESRTRSATMPTCPRSNRENRMKLEAMRTLGHEETAVLFPCNFLGMTATKFVDVVEPKDSIQNLFRSAETQNQSSSSQMKTRLPVGRNVPEKKVSSVMDLLSSRDSADQHNSELSEQERLDFEMARKLQDEENRLHAAPQSNQKKKKTAAEPRVHELAKKSRGLDSFFGRH